MGWDFVILWFDLKGFYLVAVWAFDGLNEGILVTDFLVEMFLKNLRATVPSEFSFSDRLRLLLLASN